MRHLGLSAKLAAGLGVPVAMIIFTGAVGYYSTGRLITVDRCHVLSETEGSGNLHWDGDPEADQGRSGIRIQRQRSIVAAVPTGQAGSLATNGRTGQTSQRRKRQSVTR